MGDKQNWKVIIESSRKTIDLKISETWEYRDLIFIFVKREFISKYKQTILGPLWAIIQPILTTIVFSVIFGSLAKLTTTDTATTTPIPSFLFYMIGIVVWSYFSSTVTTTSNTFIGNMHIMGKVYYPRMVTPISASISNMISFFIQLILFIIFMGYWIITSKVEMMVSPLILLVPFSIIQLIILSMGTGIIISSLTTKYRDLAMLLGFGLQLWQYASPVAYGLSLIPEKWRGLYLLNPVTPIILTMRCGFFGVGYFELSSYLLSWVISIIVLLTGLILFNRIERSFMDMI